MRYLVLDTETTGLEPGSRPVEMSSRIIEETGEEIGFNECLIDPGMPVPADAYALHGINTQEAKGTMPLKKAMVEWHQWLMSWEVTHLIAHNAPYDIGVLSWTMDFVGLSHPCLQVIDTCAMAREIKATKKNSLDALVEHYGITRKGIAHRAKSDALACRDYWLLARKLLPAYQPTPWVAPHSCPKELPPQIANLPGLVERGEPFAFTYRDAKGNQTERTITPYGWAEQNGKVYFHGLCHLRQERRTFLAENVEAVK